MPLSKRTLQEPDSPSGAIFRHVFAISSGDSRGGGVCAMVVAGGGSVMRASSALELSKQLLTSSVATSC